MADVRYTAGLTGCIKLLDLRQDRISTDGSGGGGKSSRSTLRLLLAWLTLHCVGGLIFPPLQGEFF
jgi:hypothetical protein